MDERHNGDRDRDRRHRRDRDPLGGRSRPDMNRGHVTDDERERILALLRSGLSAGATARQCGRSQPTVSRIAWAAGIDLNQCATTKAVAARRDFDLANRLALLNKLFIKADQLSETVDKPLELQQLSTAVAIMIDKRRLEDGEATSRSEVHDDSTRARLGGRLDELAARRAARLDSESHRGTG
jgi:hypothetical protein